MPQNIVVGQDAIDGGPVRRHLRRPRRRPRSAGRDQVPDRPIGALPPPATQPRPRPHEADGRPRPRARPPPRPRRSAGGQEAPRRSQPARVAEARRSRHQADPPRTGRRAHGAGSPRRRRRGRRSTGCSSSTSAGARVTAELEELRAEQNRASRARKGAPSEEQRASWPQLAARGRALSDEESAVRAQRDAELAALPNLPAPDAPAAGRGARARSARRARRGRDHLELAGYRIDMERGARLSGSRFAYLRGELVLLEFALVRFALEKLIGEGFEPVIPPVLVREQALYGTGMLPDTEQQIYRAARGRPVPGRHLGGRRSPRCTATRSWPPTSCRCATPGSPPASAARRGPRARTRGGSSACTSSTRSRCSASSSPTEAAAEHERLLAIEESILHDLEIPYRVVDDRGRRPRRLGGQEVRLEAWLPGQERYRELTSCSNTTDYQARRLDIRYRDAGRQAGSRRTRSTGPRWRWGARSSRCWRTASGRTARSPSRRFSRAMGRPASYHPQGKSADKLRPTQQADSCAPPQG